MKILHLVRSNDDRLAQRVVETMENTEDVEQTLLMIQDGVYVRRRNRNMLACADDVRSRGIETDLPLVEYERMVDMIFEYDKVITW